MKKKLFLLIACVFFSIILIRCSEAKQKVKEIPITTTSNEALELFKKGRALSEQARLDESINYFEDATKKDSSFAMAYALLSFSQYDYDKFLSYLNKAVSLVDNVSEGEKLILLAYEAMINSGDNSKAEQMLQKLISLYPQDKRAYHQLALLYFRSREFEKAIMQHKKSIQLDPNFAEPYNLIGYCYSYLGNYNEAEKALKKYAELLPDAANPHDSYGEILMKQGKFDESIKEYRKALSIDPNFDLSYVGLGTNLIFKGSPNEGRKQFQKLYNKATKDGKRKLALNEIANSYIHENKFNLAIQELQKSYALAEKNNNQIDMSRDLNRIADIYLEIGSLDEAKEKYLKSLELINKSEIASEEQKIKAKRDFLYDEVCIALKEDDLTTAKSKTEQYRKQIEIENNPVVIRTYHKLLGLIALHEKNYQDALNELLQANQRNPRTLCGIAEAYKGLGNNEKTKEFWVKAANFNEISTSYAFVRNKAIKKLAELK